MKVYILADGEGTRWNNWGGVPKQLLKVNDETILDRMIRLCVENGLDNITIVGDFKNKYAKNIKLYCDNKIDLFIKVAEESKEPFVLLNGDVFYTEEIIKDIVKRNSTRWLHWMNPSENKNTGKTWAEGYAYKVQDVKTWTKRLINLKKKIESGEIEFKNGWLINNYLSNETELYIPKITVNDILWNDNTDDFDFSSRYYESNGFSNDYLRFIYYTGYKGME